VLQRVAVTWCACATCNICVTDIRSTMTVMLQCVAVYSCCSVLQRVAVYLCCSVLQCIRVAVCCSVFVLQCVVMCCSALRCVVMTQCACATCNIRMTDIRSMTSAMLQCVAVYSCGSVLQTCVTRGEVSGQKVSSGLFGNRSEAPLRSLELRPTAPYIIWCSACIVVCSAIVT
jgi:hypothetical protein